MPRHQFGGRHRLGTPGLQHCQEFPSVRARVSASERTRHTSDHGSPTMRPAYAVGVGLLAVLVSGWLTAGHALAQQLAHH